MSHDSTRAPIDLPAGIVALLFPGAGHLLRGQIYRGLMACLGVLGLFFGGMFIGGIDVIDSKEDRIWFLGQALVGPVAFGVDTLHQKQFKAWAPVTGLTGRPHWDTRSGYPNESRVWSDANNRYEWVAHDPADADAPPPPNTKSIAKMNEIGTLYATLAGMLNFIIILDALIPARRGRGATDNSPLRAGLATEVAATTASAEVGT
ncbi:MAG: DUF6677 family protein [Phycisphaerales bacterium JB059]